MAILSELGLLESLRSTAMAVSSSSSRKGKRAFLRGSRLSFLHPHAESLSLSLQKRHGCGKIGLPDEGFGCREGAFFSPLMGGGDRLNLKPSILGLKGAPLFAPSIIFHNPPLKVQYKLLFSFNFNRKLQHTHRKKETAR